MFYEDSERKEINAHPRVKTGPRKKKRHLNRCLTDEM